MIKLNKFIYFVYPVIVCVCSSMVIPVGWAEEDLSVPEQSSTQKIQRISLDLKGMEVVEALQILVTKGNLNVVIGNNVRGRVTLFLKDVEIRDAFEMILSSNNLACDPRNGILYVITDREYENLYGRTYGDAKQVKIIKLKYGKAAEVAKALDQIKTKIGKVIVDEGSNTVVLIDTPAAVRESTALAESIDNPTVTKVFELKYAEAKSLKEKVEGILSKTVGKYQLDERSNKIVVTDFVDKVNDIEKMIKAFDDKLQQVLIEAKIVEITLNDEHKLGVDWQSLFSKFARLISVKNSFQLASQGALSPGGELVVGSLSDSNYTFMLQALKTVGDTNLLASPRIMALSNQEAKILIGSNQPYATNTVTQTTGAVTTATNLTFIEIGVKLYVTPTVNRDGFVTMKIKPEVSAKTGDYTYGSPATTVPVISTTQAETNVMVKDGTTIVIAGLIKDERTNAVSKVPILGDIPVVDTAFKKTDKTVSKKELVIFITPHIVSGETSYSEQPMTSPIGDDRYFTVPEYPAFKRREPNTLDPTYFKNNQTKSPKKTNTQDLEKTSPEYYYTVLKDRVTQNMDLSDRPLTSGERIKISFLLSSGGNLISEPRVIESSSDVFKTIALEALQKASPFPSFPLSINQSQKRFTLDFYYESSPNSNTKKL